MVGQISKNFFLYYLFEKIIIDWFRILSSNLPRSEEIHKISKVAILQPDIDYT